MTEEKEIEIDYTGRMVDSIGNPLIFRKDVVRDKYYIKKHAGCTDRGGFMADLTSCERFFAGESNTGLSTLINKLNAAFKDKPILFQMEDGLYVSWKPEEGHNPIKEIDYKVSAERGAVQREREAESTFVPSIVKEEGTDIFIATTELDKDTAQKEGWIYKFPHGSGHYFYRDFDGTKWYELYIDKDIRDVTRATITRKRVKDTTIDSLVQYEGKCPAIKDLIYIYNLLK